MAGARYSTSRPFFPIPAWTSELLAVLLLLLFSFFFVFIYLPFAVLYHSGFRVCIDMLFSMKLELPPAKRRKGLAGSVLSAAVSAALIGTAVGLTMYRL